MNEPKLDDPALEARLAAMPEDGIFIYALAASTLRLALVHGSRTVAKARAARGYDAGGARVFGEALLLGGLFASTLKGDDRVTLSLDSGGAEPSLLVEAGADGSVRGYLKDAPGAERAQEGAAPSLVITRGIAGAPRPFVGRIALVDGGLAANLAEYFDRSEQTPSAARAVYELDAQGGLGSASAALVQALPGAEAELFASIARALAAAPEAAFSFATGAGPDEVAALILSGYSPQRLGERAFRWFCPCSKERFAATLSGLGEGLRELADHGPWPVETTCAACGSRYRFSREELRALLAARS